MSSDNNELPIISIRKSRNSRRTLSFFTRNYHFAEPLKVLLDWPMTRFMFENHITDQDISRLLQGRRVQLRVTRCTLTRIKESCIALGLVIRKRDLNAKLIGCGHAHTIDSQECIESMLVDDNNLGFFVACGEEDLRTRLSKMAGVPLICHNGRELVFRKPSSEQKQFAKEAHRRRVTTPAYEEQMRNFNYVSDSDKKLEYEAFELRDGETLHRSGSPKAWRKRKWGAKLRNNKPDLSYEEEDESGDEDRVTQDLNDRKLKDHVQGHYTKSELYTGFQHFSDENDSEGKRKKMGATAGSSKHFSDENDSEGKRKKMGATAGSSKHFSDENDSEGKRKKRGATAAGSSKDNRG